MTMDGFVEEGHAGDEPSLLQRSPLEDVQQSSHTGVSSVLTSNKPRSFPLDCFQLFYVVVLMGVPHRTCVLQYRSDERFVSECPSVLRAAVEITSEHVQCPLRFRDGSIYVSSPVQTVRKFLA